MPVGLLTLELHIQHAQSLKDKRQVLRSLKDRLRAKFNVAVAELEHHDDVAAVGGRRGHTFERRRSRGRIVAERPGRSGQHAGPAAGQSCSGNHLALRASCMRGKFAEQSLPRATHLTRLLRSMRRTYRNHV